MEEVPFVAYPYNKKWTSWWTYHKNIQKRTFHAQKLVLVLNVNGNAISLQKCIEVENWKYMASLNLNMSKIASNLNTHITKEITNNFRK